MTEAFERAYRRILDLIPDLELRPGKAMRAVHLIQDWLGAGCDVDLDILPGINKAFARCAGAITSPTIFDKWVRRAMQERTGAVEAKERNERFLAEALAWKRKVGMFVSDRDEQWLDKYLAKHGPLAQQPSKISRRS